MRHPKWVDSQVLILDANLEEMKANKVGCSRERIRTTEDNEKGHHLKNRIELCHTGSGSDKPDSFSAHLTGWHLYSFLLKFLCEMWG